MLARCLAAFLATGLLTPGLSAQTLSQTEYAPNLTFLDNFGSSVALDGDRAVVGAPGEGSPLAPSGAVYVYDRVGSAWVETARIDPTALGVRELGTQVDSSGNRIVASAPGLVGASPAPLSLFELQGGVWTHVAGPGSGLPLGLTYGRHLALDGDTLVASDFDSITATGLVRVFERGAGAWSQSATLSVGGSQVLDLALEGDRLAASNGTGLVYLFERTGSAWDQVQRLDEASVPAAITQGAPTGQFGRALAIDGDLLVVGAPNAFGYTPGTGIFNLGAIYTFERSGPTWAATDRFENSRSSFGTVLEASDGTILVGTPSTSPLPIAVLRRDAGASTWSERASIAIPPEVSSASPQDLAWGNGVLAVGTPRAITGTITGFVGMAQDPVSGTRYGTDGSMLFEVRGEFDVIQIGPLGWNEVKSLALDPSAGVLYGVDVVTGELLSIDPATGAATSLGTLSSAAGIRGLAFDTSTGTLYAANSNLDELMTIDPATAQVSVVGAIGFLKLRSLAYDPVRDVLAGVNTPTKELVHLDRTTGAGTAVGQMVIDQIQGLAWDPLSSTFTAAEQGNQYHSVDPDSGALLSSNYTWGWVGAFSIGAPDLLESYCTAGTSAAGCTALVSATGGPSATDPSGFLLDATGAPGSTQGLFFFGTTGRQANAWGSGSSFQCVAPPVRRAGLQLSSGSNGACDGVFSQDLNALWCPTCPKAATNPGPGVFVQAQLWYRDPLSTSNQSTSLSDAIEFAVGP